MFEKGEIVYNDGNGILAAPSTVTGPFMMALEASTHPEYVATTGPDCVNGKTYLQIINDFFLYQYYPVLGTFKIKTDFIYIEKHVILIEFSR